MMTVGIVVNETKHNGPAIAHELAAAVAARGGRSVIAAGDGDGDGNDKECYHAEAADVIICIGGDGTLIKVAREAVFGGAPILGVNLGSLGYLTEVETSQLGSILDRIFTRDYWIEERMMLSISRYSGPADTGNACGADHVVETALNELAISRGDSPHILRLKLFIDGSFLDVFSGDGVLVSTPTGSTAYALSAGGPIIDPELNVMSIVPVCPHAVFARPVIIAPDKEITIVPVNTGNGFSADVSADGFRRPKLRDGEAIKIRRSSNVTKMLRFGADNFYVSLKNKLFQSSNKF